MEAFLGSIMMWPMNWAPVGWMMCQGQTLPINQYQALFSLLGTTYGGNGTTNFMLPNLQGVFPLGMGPANALGMRGGAASVTLTAAEMPAHTHAATFTPTGSAAATAATPLTATLLASSAPGTVSNPSGNFIANAAYPGGSTGSGDSVGPSLCNSFTPKANAGTTVPIAGLTISGSLGSAAGITGGSVTNAVTGGSAPVPTMPPYLVMNFIICMQGLFPSRS